jgi:hypothetical protein
MHYPVSRVSDRRQQRLFVGTPIRRSHPLLENACPAERLEEGDEHPPVVPVRRSITESLICGLVARDEPLARYSGDDVAGADDRRLPRHAARMPWRTWRSLRRRRHRAYSTGQPDRDRVELPESQARLLNPPSPEPISIWHQSGVPARELAERAGHARPSMSLDVYSHVMPPDEIAAEKFLPLLSTRR